MADDKWREMSLVRLRAAKALLNLGLYRDSISRSYYAAYCAATSVVMGQKAAFAHGFGNPSHQQLPDLILNVAGINLPERRKIKRHLRTLREASADADYRPWARSGRQEALAGVHYALSVLEALEVRENGSH